MAGSIGPASEPSSAMPGYGGWFVPFRVSSFRSKIDVRTPVEKKTLREKMRERHAKRRNNEFLQAKIKQEKKTRKKLQSEKIAFKTYFVFLRGAFRLFAWRLFAILSFCLASFR